MTRETIKEYILQVKSQDGTEALYNRWEPDILVEVINEIYNDHEEQLKAKDEEVKNIEIQAFKTILHMQKKSDKKARSIVAMLFWTSKRSKRGSFYNHAKIEMACFIKAYKMLKETK